MIECRATGTGRIKKNAPLCFLYISAPIKATEIVFIWEEIRDSTVCFEYKTDSEQYTVVEILAKCFGASISWNVVHRQKYNSWFTLETTLQRAPCLLVYNLTVVTVSHRRSTQIQKFISQKLTGAFKNLNWWPFKCHWWSFWIWQMVWCCSHCSVAGRKRVLEPLLAPKIRVRLRILE